MTYILTDKPKRTHNFVDRAGHVHAHSHNLSQTNLKKTKLETELCDSTISCHTVRHYFSDVSRPWRNAA